MKSLVTLAKLRILEKLIHSESTGTSEQLAQRLHISRSKLFELIDELKLKGVPISYSKKKKSFVFDRPLELLLKAEVTFLDNEEVIDISGGQALQNMLCSINLCSA